MKSRVKKNDIDFESLCVKEAHIERSNPPHILPIYASSSFDFTNIEEAISVFKGEKEGLKYSRYENPTSMAVAQKIAAMESFGLSDLEPEAILTNSGMSAIQTMLISLLKSGDAIISQANIYGGTTELFKKVLSRLGIECHFINLKELDLVESCIKAHPTVKVICFETPSNPVLDCIDMEAINNLAHQYGLKTVCDNTFPTPYLQQPFKYGTDFIIHSTTKFLNGHGNAIGGIMIGRDALFMKERVWEMMKLSGTNPDPFSSWLLHNGLKTLHIRMDRHSSNALQLAEFFHNHPSVQKVNYPGLPTHPEYTLAKKQMKKPGAMMSIELAGGFKAGLAFINQSQMGSLAPTLGDVDTLLLHPASSSHVNIPKEFRLQNQITDGLIRINVGIESIKDLIQDFGQALD